MHGLKPLINKTMEKSKEALQTKQIRDQISQSLESKTKVLSKPYNQTLFWGNTQFQINPNKI